MPVPCEVSDQGLGLLQNGIIDSPFSEKIQSGRLPENSFFIQKQTHSLNAKNLVQKERMSFKQKGKILSFSHLSH